MTQNTPRTDDELGTLDGIILDVVRDLYRDAGISMSPGPASQEDSMLAFIGFTSAEVNGSLLVATDLALCAKMLPADLAESPTDLARCDVTAETANQLLGRIKNRLVPFGITLILSTPRALRCTSFTLAMRPSPWNRAHHLTSAHGAVSVWFSATVSRDLHLVQRLDTPECAAEGETMLF